MPLIGAPRSFRRVGSATGRPAHGAGHGARPRDERGRQFGVPDGKATEWRVAGRCGGYALSMRTPDPIVLPAKGVPRFLYASGFPGGRPLLSMTDDVHWSLRTFEGRQDQLPDAASLRRVCELHRSAMAADEWSAEKRDALGTDLNNLAAIGIVSRDPAGLQEALIEAEEQFIKVVQFFHPIKPNRAFVALGVVQYNMGVGDVLFGDLSQAAVSFGGARRTISAIPEDERDAGYAGYAGYAFVDFALRAVEGQLKRVGGP